MKMNAHHTQLMGYNESDHLEDPGGKIERARGKRHVQKVGGGAF